MALLRSLPLALVALALLAAQASATGTLVADYRFDDNLNSSVAGAPPLENIGTGNVFAWETVKGIPNRVLTFPKDNGLHLNTSGLVDNGNYSVVIDFRFSTIDPTPQEDYARILNWRDPAGQFSSDSGLYAHDKALDLYDGSDRGPGTDVFAANQYVEVAVARLVVPGFGGDAQFNEYVNGSYYYQYYDIATGAITALNADGMRFFKDDGAVEESGGAVSRIRVYNGTLESSEVQAIAAEKDPAPPETDGDGVYDYADNCPSVANANQADRDTDGQGDVCDDGDGDGVTDAQDNCVASANADQANLDGDSQGDACDADDDGDGVADTADNCPTVNGADHGDPDHDGLGNPCDTDDDGDGVADTADSCPLSPIQIDTDRDSLADPCDPDDDGDAVPDTRDRCPLFARVGLNGCPPGALKAADRTRTRRNGKRGIKLSTGIQALCPATPLQCRVTGSVKRATGRPKRLGKVELTLKPDFKKSVAIELTKKGAAALRKAGGLRVRIVLTMVGPDGAPVQATKRVRLRAPH